MAKKRIVIGEVCKTKDGTRKYLKVKSDISLKDGDYLDFHTKKDKEADIEEGEKTQRLTEETAERLRGYLSKWANFKIAEVSVLREER